MKLLRLTALLATTAMAACNAGFAQFPVSDSTQSSLPDSVNVVQVTAENVAELSPRFSEATTTTLAANDAWSYRVGTGDILQIIVFGHPELADPSGSGNLNATTGFRIGADGTVFYPYVGQVAVAGKTPEEVRTVITERLSEYIPSPQVDVRISQFNSQSIVVTGKVARPARETLSTTPLTLVDAITAAGGLTNESDASRVRLQRRGNTYFINLEAFLENGATGGNPVLRDGDVVNVPNNSARQAYVLGAVQRPAIVDLTPEGVTVTEALSGQGGVNEIRADARGIFVFRENGEKIDVYQFDTSSPVGLLLGTHFVLRPQDVIYVVRSPLTRWNDSISQILPSVQALNAAQALQN